MPRTFLHRSSIGRGISISYPFSSGDQRAQLDGAAWLRRPADLPALAQRWQDLLNQSTGGDPGIEQAMTRLWEEQGGTLAARFGSKYDSRPVWCYIRTAIGVSKSSA